MASRSDSGPSENPALRNGEIVNSTEALARAPRALVSINDIAQETSESHSGPWQQTWPAGTWRKNLGVDPSSQGATFLLYLPAGYGRAEEAAIRSTLPLGRFEAHSCHEEIFNLGGQYKFADWYDFPELGYLNHPPTWVHPADQSTSTGVLLLIKNSSPVDFEFSPIPDGWDGAEGSTLESGGLDAETGGVTMLATNGIPWQKMSASDGTDLGVEVKHLWKDAGSGWSTWIMKAPSGWVSPIPATVREGGDEIFLLEGDLIHSRHGAMAAQSYFCDSDDIEFGGESSENGFLAIRWTRGDEQFTLPAVVGQGTKQVQAK